MRFFQGQKLRAEREAEAMRAFDSYQTVMKRVETCAGLERAFEQLCPDAQPYLWLEDYERLPITSWTRARDGFSDMVSAVQRVQIPHEHLMDGVSLDIPDQAAYKLARRRGDEILLGCAIEIDAALKTWSTQRTWQIDEADGPIVELVVDVMAVSLYELRYLFSDLAMTVIYWNAGPDIANPYVIEVETWKHAQNAPADRLRQLLTATPLTTQDHALFETIVSHGSVAVPSGHQNRFTEQKSTSTLRRVGRWLLFGLIASMYIAALYALLGAKAANGGGLVVVGCGIIASFGTMALPGALRKRRLQRDNLDAYRKPSAKYLRAQLRPTRGGKIRKFAVLVIGGLFALVIAIAIGGELLDRNESPVQQQPSTVPAQPTPDAIQELKDRRDGMTFPASTA